MYKINDIKSIHLEITNKCQASCPMCARNLQGGVTSPFVDESEVRLDKFVEWFDVDFIKQLDKLYMCGNLGDPIIAHDTLDIFEYCRTHNSQINLSMNTNGSARDEEFWKSLARLNVTVRFGIDGLEDTHSLYRKGTAFHTIIKNAKAFIGAGGTAIWDMLVFKHNEHQVNECERLSKELGFDQFVRKDTARFKENKLDVLDREGKKVYTIYPSQISSELTKKISAEPANINCKVKSGSLYISSHGIVTPCCWLELSEIPHVNPSRIDYLSKIEKYYSLHNYRLRDIFSTGYFDKISNLWDHDPLLECTRQCGSFDKFNNQFTKI